MAVKPVQLDQAGVAQNLKAVGIGEQFDASDTLSDEGPEQLTITWWP
jgi:hypothetical protein